MSKSVLYAGNTNTQTTTVPGITVEFPNIVRRYGKALNIIGGNTVINESGYYSGIVNLTYNGTAAGTLNVQVNMDGVPIPFATARITTAQDVTSTISIPFRVRDMSCGCRQSSITVIAGGVVVDITNASMSIERS